MMRVVNACETARDGPARILLVTCKPQLMLVDGRVQLLEASLRFSPIRFIIQALTLLKTRYYNHYTARKVKM